MTEENRTLKGFISNKMQRMEYSFSKEEALEETNMTDNSFKVAASRLNREGKLIRPRGSFYVIVPPQYRRRGAPPANVFIDDLMEFLNKSYYVGLLSAAAIFGAAHQMPQEYQVVVRKQIKKIVIKNLRIIFIQNKRLADVPITEINTEFSRISVSTPEATAIDLVYYDNRSGYLDNVATVLKDLSEKISPEELLVTAKSYHNLASIQRLGYILENIGEEELCQPLKDWISTQSPSRVPLSTQEARAKGTRDRNWEVIVNYELNPD